jgi:hypothetical protein
MATLYGFVWLMVFNATFNNISASATPDFSTNNTDRHDIAEILLKVALKTISQTKPYKVAISF